MKRYEALRDLIIQNGFTSVAEIGVREGETMRFLLQNCPITQYLAVDIDMRPLVAREFCDRKGVVLLEQSSISACQFVADKSLDMVFIDADHSYKHVTQDIDNWISKVRVGGIICGHDYQNPAHRDVERAVKDYFRIHVECIPDPAFIWYVRIK